MRDTEVSNNAICKSIEKTVDERIQTLLERIEKNKEKLNSNTIGFAEKMGIKITNKQYEDETKKLTELNQALGNLHFSDSSNYKMPETFLEKLNDLGTLLINEEINEIRNVVNSSLRNANKDKKEQIKTASLQVQKILNKVGLLSSGFLVTDGLEYKKSMTYQDAVLTVEKNLLKKLTPEYTPIHSGEKEIELPHSEKMLLDSIEKMITNKDFEQTKSTKNIIENISEIKDAMLLKEKCSKIQLKIANLINELNSIVEINTTAIKEYLTKLTKKYQIELNKANAFLAKFDFQDIKKQIEEKKAKENQEEIKTNAITTCVNLSYELEKVLTEDPNNYQKIQELESQIHDYANKFGLDETQINNAKSQGKAKYQEEVTIQKNKVLKEKERIEYEDELKKGVMAELREEAIRELERNNAFDENYEIVNGDIRSMGMDKEGMIRRKMEELMQLAEMTPEERGLYDFKKRGIIKPDATIDDLTAQQLNDIRIGYSDESYEFMADYKTWKSRENVKPQANTIYKEYIKYRANLQNKNEFLSFSEYAKQKHNLEQMSEIMVDANLKEEMSETLKETSR